MEKRKNLIIFSFICLFLIILLTIQVNPLLINKFDSLGTSENLTFTGNQNITRNISIERYANVSNANMNLTGNHLSVNLTNYSLLATLNVTPYALACYDVLPSNDGTKLYYSDTINVTQFDCSTPWNASTCTFSGKVYYFPLLTMQYLFSILFNSDGTKLYFYEFGGDQDIRETHCSTPWDVSTCIYSNSLSPQGSTTGTWDFVFSLDGTRLYSVNINDNKIYQYVCSDAWNVSSCSYSNININTHNNSITSIYFESDGKALYELHNPVSGTWEIYKSICSDAWNLSSCSYDSQSIDFGTKYPQGFNFGNDMSDLYLIGFPKYKIYQYHSPFNYSSYPKNSSVSINNTNIWNYTAGEFNKTDNTTSDFSSVINTALNGGACDCVGCVVVGNNCSINLTFHSNTEGILKYSAINITYTLPSITLDVPINGYTYGTNKSLELNFTYTNFTSTDCFYNVKNSTNGYVISNTTIASCQNTTFNISQGNGNYNLTIYLNGSYGIMTQDSNSFSLVIDSPAINLIYPENNSAFNNGTNRYFNFTATDSDGVGTCELWGNWGGLFHKNYTWVSPGNGVQNYTLLNMSEIEAIWTIWCNDSLDNKGYAVYNYTFIIDLTYPNVSINSITTTAGSQTFSFNYTSQDQNIEECFYSIFNSTFGIDGTNKNVSFTCGTSLSTTATATSYGTFNLTIYTNDSAGNLNSSTKAFTLSASSPGGGGGGGGINTISVIALKKPSNYTKLLTDLQRAILYIRIRESCLNYSSIANCKLVQSYKTELQNILKEQTVELNITEINSFINQFTDNEVEEVKIDETDVDRYNLFKATLEILESPFKIEALDRFWIIRTDTIQYIVRSNRIISSCKVEIGELGWSCLPDGSTAIITYELQQYPVDFLAKVIPVTISFVSDEKESVFLDGQIRALSVKFLIILGGLLTIVGIPLFIVRKKIVIGVKKIFKR